jgi:hypothetical protein
VPTIKVGRWRLVVIPRDHYPMHVHARQGSGNAPTVVIELNPDGVPSLRRSRHDLSRADTQQVLEIVAEHFAELVELWERYC